ncbi:5'/3'-nucleotidase SurE [Ilumatobacter nonamiensis]|uniref:5'/3'-nucleotidase SurE n=1 Tax=Ilumatobacter nonamiensis TaxID=467093 RepID=UPI00034ADAC3|nr:5'/3'-nucleotidase SurE [Ilumatobacter nonamiensis]
MRLHHMLALPLALVLAVSACGGSDESSDPSSPVTDAAAEPADTEPAETTAPPTSAEEATTTASPTTTTTSTTTTTPAPKVLEILVTNDDGIRAPGIDTLVEALRAVPDVEVVLVAPSENQSGSSDTTTAGAVTSADGTTATGFPGTAVMGTPADSVGVALGELGLMPDLVVSGVNSGQNIGPFVDLSGTVGAARTAARAGVPAIAVSSGLVPDEADASFSDAAAYVVAFIAEHRADDGSLDLAVSVTSVNVPSCTDGGQIRGLVEVPVATAFPDGADPFASDCNSESTEPADDYAAVSTGFASISDVGF